MTFAGPDQPASTRVAALDLGSNSFHLLVAEVGPDGSVTPILREKEMLRLGETVARTGVIGDRADEVIATLRRLRALIDAADAASITTCATAALRDAGDRDEIVARAAAEAGIDIRVITGLEEARLIFEAVRASLVLEPAPALCLDLGGGSLEITIGDAGGLQWARSVPLGVGRLTADHVRDDPPAKGDLKRVRAAIAAELDPLADDIDRHDPKMLVGTSGTLCDLATVALYQRDGVLPPSINQVSVTRKELAGVHERLTRMTTSERRGVVGLEPRRAEVVVAGSTVLLAFMDRFDMDRLTVGDWALREGMLLDAAGPARSSSSNDIRRTSVLDLCRRYGWPERHSRHVAALAVSLFDQMLPLHGMDATARELLEYGAFLHDIGGHVSAQDHEQHTAYLIEHGRLRGFDPGEIAMLASLGRYHRRGRPRTDFAPYDALRPDRRLAVDMLVGLLRLAHGLDHARAGSVSGVNVGIDGKGVVVTVTAGAADIDLELWGAERAGKSFERAFARSLSLEVAAPRDASSVA